MPNSAGSKKAAALSRGTHVERKEFRRRIRLTYRKELSFSLTYIVYQIFWLVQIFIGFFCRQQMTTIGIQCSIRQPVQYSSSGLRNLKFRQQLFVISSLYMRAKPPACHCTSFRLDRPALSRPPYLLYRANLGLPFVNNVSFQAPSAPAITFQEPQVNLPH